MPNDPDAYAFAVFSVRNDEEKHYHQKAARTSSSVKHLFLRYLCKTPTHFRSLPCTMVKSRYYENTRSFPSVWRF